MYSSDEEEVDHELLELLRKNMTITPAKKKADTKVLSSANYIVDNAIDVALHRESVVKAAEQIYQAMQIRSYSTKTWNDHVLHPQTKDEEAVKFIFTMDLLNFSFWSAKPESERFSVTYGGQRYTGYWSLVAALRRALDEGIPITSPYFWVDEGICTDEILHHVFRSDTEEQMPLLKARITCLREAGSVLCENFDGDITNLIAAANNSASELVLLLVENFFCFQDEAKFQGRKVNFYKRAQILVADLWACFDGESYGKFDDIDTITMFADYRVPVILHALGCLIYAPTLEGAIKDKQLIESGSSWEVQLRGCSIWCVEMIRRTIKQHHPEANVNAILIDFYLYDAAKEMEKAYVQREGHENTIDMLPHHRVRSIWY